MNYTIANLERDYELELGKLSVRIKELSVGSVLLQLPDGLKPYGVVICDYLSERCDVEIRVWLGSCFGACDLPTPSAGMRDEGGGWRDVLVVQFGHAVWE